MKKLNSFILFMLFMQNVLSEITVDGIKMSTSLECLRECKENESPKTCYYSFTIEFYGVLGRACELCTPNKTNEFTSDCQCVLADGVEKGLLTVNRQFPGPSIQVCKNDIVVVDVINLAEGISTTIHWHGVWQTGTPWSDGVPFVTQCPIYDGNIFRYKFVAANPGTHFWHSHSAFQKIDGLCGKLIVRAPKSADLSRQLYHYDLPDHVIIMNDWMHEYAAEKFPGRTSYYSGQDPESILINGKGRTKSPWTGCRTKTPIETFDIRHKKKYRFRLINAFATVCPAQFNIEKHKMKVIATDGVDVEPVDVDTIISFSGERIDFVIEGSYESGTFWIQVKGLGECGVKRIQQLAILHYEKSATIKPKSKPPTYDKGLPLGKVLNPLDYFFCGSNSTQGICYHQLRAVSNTQDTNAKKTLKSLKFFVEFKSLTPQHLYVPHTYNTALETPDSGLLSTAINNITYINPSSPLLSQKTDIDPQAICNKSKKPAKCNDIHKFCRCTHVEELPLDATVEIVLVDSTASPNISHPFHLHGGTFEVLDTGYLGNKIAGKINIMKFDDLEKSGKIKKNVDHPPSKDTIAVPYNGYVILRASFVNPGYWFFHCHFLAHLLIGMNVVFQIGAQEEIPKVPDNFPVCGHFKPTIKQQAPDV